jgi:hypothetical protein
VLFEVTPASGIASFAQVENVLEVALTPDVTVAFKLTQPAQMDELLGLMLTVGGPL